MTAKRNRWCAASSLALWRTPSGLDRSRGRQQWGFWFWRTRRGYTGGGASVTEAQGSRRPAGNSCSSWSGKTKSEPHLNFWDCFKKLITQRRRERERVWQWITGNNGNSWRKVMTLTSLWHATDFLAFHGVFNRKCRGRVSRTHELFDSQIHPELILFLSFFPE